MDQMIDSAALEAAFQDTLRQREREQLFEERSVPSLVAQAIAIPILCALPMVDMIHGALRVTVADMLTIFIPYVLILAGASVTVRWPGLDSMSFKIFNVLENSLTGCIGPFLVWRSGHAESVFWLMSFAYANVMVNGVHKPRLTAATLLVPGLAVALAFWLVDGLPGQAALTLIVELVLIVDFVMTRQTPIKLARATAERDLLLRRVSAMQLDAERTRIARDLHDGVAADLTALMLNLRAMREQAGEDALTDEIDAMADRASRSMDDLRGVVWALRADEVNWSELIARFESVGQGLCRGGPSFEVHVDGELPSTPLSGGERLHLLRLVQEGVRNGVRHANATRVDVRVGFADDALSTLDIVDDGDGLDADSFGASTRGLASMRARAAALGGVLELADAAKGTHLRASFSRDASRAA